MFKKIFSCLFLVMLLFFTFFGDDIYFATKPVVTLDSVVTSIIDDVEHLRIPKTSVVGENTVYTVEYQNSFVGNQMIAKKNVVTVEDDKTDTDYFIVTSGIKQGQTVIATSDRDINDNDIVIEAE